MKWELAGADRKRISGRSAAAWTYWRSSQAVAGATGRGVILASVFSTLIALFGVLVLVLDVAVAAG
jgi:hypothetical protein